MNESKTVTRRTIFKMALMAVSKPKVVAALPPADVPLWLWLALKEHSSGQRSGILRLGGGGALSNTDWFLRRNGPPLAVGAMVSAIPSNSCASVMPSTLQIVANANSDGFETPRSMRDTCDRSNSASKASFICENLAACR